MAIYITLILTSIIVFTICCILLVKWHDKKIKETRDRAISAGCPFFTDI